MRGNSPSQVSLHSLEARPVTVGGSGIGALVCPVTVIVPLPSHTSLSSPSMGTSSRKPANWTGRADREVQVGRQLQRIPGAAGPGQESNKEALYRRAVVDQRSESQAIQEYSILENIGVVEHGSGAAPSADRLCRFDAIENQRIGG